MKNYMSFNSVHLRFFLTCLSEELEEFVGSDPRSWWDYVSNILGTTTSGDLSLRRVSREDLFQLSCDSSVSSCDFAASVLAWGGMNRKHGVLAFQQLNYWIEIVEGLRSKKIDAFDAYSTFESLRSAGQLPGMGPAYFTKLIFFASGGDAAYIMDQWTGRSINLLLEFELVALNWSTYKGVRSAYVSDKNTAKTYFEFCAQVDKIALLAGGRQGSKIEMALFSKGRGLGTWRNYLKRHDGPAG